MFKVTDLHAGYGSLDILWGVNFEVGEGQIVSILGNNGAGKTTIVRAISGLIKAKSGSINFNGAEFAGQSVLKFLEAGIVQVPEGRQLFVEMTVLENLELGAYSRASREKFHDNLKVVYDYFPRLEERKSQRAGTLSGGEQQMLAVARGIISMPKLFIFDEPSLGLAPNLVDQILEVVKKLAKEEGLAVILVEQDVRKALRVSDYGYVIENGAVVLGDPAEKLMNNPEIKKAYLGY